MTRSEQIEKAARTMVSSEHAWLRADRHAECIWCGASTDSLDAILHADRCEMGAMVRALALPADPEARDPWKTTTPADVWTLLGNLADAFEGSKSLEFLTIAERDAVEIAVRVARGIPTTLPAPSPRSAPEGRCPDCQEPAPDVGILGYVCPKHAPASPPSEACPECKRGLDSYGSVCLSCGGTGRSPSPGKAP